MLELSTGIMKVNTDQSVDNERLQSSPSSQEALVHSLHRGNYYLTWIPIHRTERKHNNIIGLLPRLLVIVREISVYLSGSLVQLF